MIKIFIKYIGFMLFFIITFMFFVPKLNMFYFVEKELNKQQIIISDEVLQEQIFSLKVMDSNLYFKGVKFSEVRHIDLSSYILFNKISIENVKIEDDFKMFVPLKIDFINLSHSIINLTKIDIDAKGDFGEIKGFVDLLNKSISLTLIASSKMKTQYQGILKLMKLENGAYSYEYKF